MLNCHVFRKHERDQTCATEKQMHFLNAWCTVHDRITTTLRWRFSNEFKTAITLIHVRSTHWLAYYVGLCRACWAKDVKFWPIYRTMHVGYMSKLTVIQRNLTTLDRHFNKLPTLAQKVTAICFFRILKAIFLIFRKIF